MPDPGHSKGDNICAYTWSIWKHSTNSRSSCVISFRVHDHTTKFPSLLYPVIISELKETSRLTQFPHFTEKETKVKKDKVICTRWHTWLEAETKSKNPKSMLSWPPNRWSLQSQTWETLITGQLWEEGFAQGKRTAYEMNPGDQDLCNCCVEILKTGWGKYSSS